jgi:glycosyltransferase involved in cell wall biosynthesis
MKIVFITPNMTGGGTEKVISLFANEYVKRGIEVTIMMFAGEECAYQVDPAVELLCVSAQSHGSARIRLERLRRMRDFFKKNEGCHLFSFCTMGTVFGALATIGLHCPMLVAERTDPRSSGHDFIRNMAYRRARQLVVQTEESLNYLPASFRKKAFRLPNPVDGSVPAPFEGKRAKRVVYLGRLEPEKNPGLLLEAFCGFSRQYPEYRLEYYGAGSLEQELRDRAEKLGLSDKVLWHGFCADAKQRIADAGIFVLPSNYEGISNAMVEALAMGLPVIATNCPIGGAASYIQDGKNGLLVPVGDAAALEKAMEKIAGNEALARKLSDNARKLREECPVDKVADRLLEIAGIRK